MLAPASGVSRVRDMLPMIAEEVMAYREALKRYAQSGEVFSLEKTTINLTFDIIGKAIFGFSMGAQSNNGDALMVFEEICRAFAVERDTWNSIKANSARRKRLAAIKRIDPLLEKMVRERFDAVQRDNLDVSKKIGLSIMDLVLCDRVNEVRESGEVSANPLDHIFMETATTQMKTLLLGGSGTTTDTVCFTFMLLSVHLEIVGRRSSSSARTRTESGDGDQQPGSTTGSG